MTATNFKSGDDSEKPAFWVDGNIHASEVSASSAFCIYPAAMTFATARSCSRTTRSFKGLRKIDRKSATTAPAESPAVRMNMLRRFSLMAAMILNSAFLPDTRRQKATVCTIPFDQLRSGTLATRN